jgi:hypothetical protein
VEPAELHRSVLKLENHICLIFREFLNYVGTVVNLGVWLITLQAIGMPHVIPGLMKAVGIVYSEGKIMHIRSSGKKNLPIYK